jgi:hypothetical protein
VTHLATMDAVKDLFQLELWECSSAQVDKRHRPNVQWTTESWSRTLVERSVSISATRGRPPTTNKRRGLTAPYSPGSTERTRR